MTAKCMTVEVKLSEVDEVTDTLSTFIFMLEDERIDKNIREQYKHSAKWLRDNYFIKD